MTPRALSIQEQISGLLTGVWAADVKDGSADIVTRLTVTKNDLLAHLEANPQAAADYIEKYGEKSPPSDLHDVIALWVDGSVYRTAWMDHGKTVDVKSFSDINRAVADHVCSRAGIRI